ncbi:hypothetical protein ACQP1P_15520 [Dactylosporangium sp. CA-052675]|uniref:hypothetical protein n=1 Tax=Dactylosporangium sp. CA-052675 TaxID=3239927 RepID=UPI003D8AB3D8
MKVSISWWDLTDSDQTIDSLREYLHSEAVAAWQAVPGLRFKCWIADPAGNRWGAVMLWDHDDIVPALLPPHRAQELIGYPPQQRVRFDVEASIGLAMLGAVDG